MAESMKNIFKALVAFLIFYLCVNLFDRIVSNVGHSLFDYEKNTIHNYRFLPLPVADYITPRYYLTIGPILIGGALVLFSESPFKRWILYAVFILMPVSPWIISMLLAVLPTVTHIDVLYTAIVSLRLLLYAFVANKLVGWTISKPHKANDYETGTATTLLLV